MSEHSTLRDQMAMAALPKSMEIVWENKDGIRGNLNEASARSAYEIADAMMNERNK